MDKNKSNNRLINNSSYLNTPWLKDYTSMINTYDIFIKQIEIKVIINFFYNNIKKNIYFIYKRFII